MELKFQKLAEFESKVISFNRTFMELKSRSLHGLSWLGASFNRTFMELKYYKQVGQIIMGLVLIVPLWN